MSTSNDTQDSRVRHIVVINYASIIQECQSEPELLPIFQHKLKSALSSLDCDIRVLTKKRDASFWQFCEAIKSPGATVTTSDIDNITNQLKKTLSENSKVLRGSSAQLYLIDVSESIILVKKPLFNSETTKLKTIPYGRADISKVNLKEQLSEIPQRSRSWNWGWSWNNFTRYFACLNILNYFWSTKKPKLSQEPSIIPEAPISGNDQVTIDTVDALNAAIRAASGEPTAAPSNASVMGNPRPLTIEDEPSVYV
jgi:hypothetical protein